MRHETSRSGRLAYAAYDAAGVAAAVLALPLAPLWLWYGYGRGLAQRLGLSQTHLAELCRSRPAWVHAASVGEVRAAVPLIEEIRRYRPAVPLVVSTTTLTGRAVVEADIRPELATLLPIDPLHTIDRVLGALAPRCLVIVETEIWPGLFRAAHRLRIPIVVVSGRISARSLTRYGRVLPLIRAALSYVADFGMQTAADAERMIALGAPPERVHVTGSLKSTPTPEPRGERPDWLGLGVRPLLIAASTQPSEEEFVLAASVPVWDRHPDAVLLLAPRRPERFAETEALLRQKGISYERWTAMTGPLQQHRRVLLLDTVGELVRFLPLATAVFVGGTVAPLGGHNVLEPATFAKPVAFGPHTEGVADAATRLQAAGGGVAVSSSADLSAFWSRCLDDPDEAQEMGARAQAVALAGREALARTWALVEPHLGEP